MSCPVGDTDAVFHSGEVAVQSRSGVAEEAARLSPMLEPARLSSGVARYLAGRTFAALTARDADGRLWISPLAGSPGFLHVSSGTTLDVLAPFAEGDPLYGLAAAQPVGLIVVEFAARRRLRFNGTLTHAGPDGLRVEVEQAYGNCPRHIQNRHLHPASAPEHGTDPVRKGTVLTPDDVDLIHGSDTFLIGSTHPTAGTDASHRGGPAGFVRVEDGRLWWPDYWGNNMFNTLGNLQVDPTAALLFLDFPTGRTLHLSGRASLEWIDPGIPGDDDDSGRRVHFDLQRLVAGQQFPLRADPDTATAALGNPPLSDGPA